MVYKTTVKFGAFKGAPYFLYEYYKLHVFIKKYSRWVVLQEIVSGILNELNEIHKDYYTYLMPEKMLNKHDFKVICPRHGDIKIPIKIHLKGIGCFQCFGNKKENIFSIIARFKGMWGEFFDYTNTCHVANTIKIQVTCRLHGEFWLKPSTHLSGSCCKACMSEGLTPAIARLLSIKEAENFSRHIANAVIEAPDFFQQKKTFAFCYLHGEYKRTKEDQNCPHCNELGFNRGELIIDNKPPPILNTAALRAIAGFLGNGEHGVKRQGVKLLSCAKHNLVRPKQHPDETCPYCLNKPLNTENLKKEFSLIYGDTYSYEKLDYRNHHTPITVTCRVHGDFEISHLRHRKGMGCPLCKKTIIKK